MADSQHPTESEIEKYVRDTLTDEKHLEIGEHIYSCKQCMEKARTEYKNSIIIENWSAGNAGELLWRMEIMTELKNRTVFQDFGSDTETEEKLAAESYLDKEQSIIRHYYSKDKKVIATVEYSPLETEVSFETREKELSDAVIVFAFVRMNTKKIILCDKVKLGAKSSVKGSPGVWENRWQGKIAFSPDLTLLFTW